MKCGDVRDITITRFEANFDRACDEAYRLAVSMFGINEDGHSERIKDWERSRCWIQLDFVSYIRSGQEHCYTFFATPKKSEDD